MLRSNCLVEAMRLFRQRLREWDDAGRPPNAEPYMLVRPSRVPGGLCHFLVGRLDTTMDAITVESFKPVDPHPRGILYPPVVFDGEWAVGDTEPMPLDAQAPGSGGNEGRGGWRRGEQWTHGWHRASR